MGASSAEALRLLRAGRAAEAERLLRASLASGGADADAIHLLGFLLATTGRLAEGMPLLDRAVALAPGNVGYLDNRAQVLMQAGLVDEAVRDASAVTSIEPRFPQGWLHLAQALRRQGRAAESLAAAERALALDPAHAAAAYHAAIVRLDLGDSAAGERGLARVIELDPRHAAAHNNLGIVQRASGRETQALESFARAVALEPGNAAAQNNLGLALQQAGRVAEAFEAFVRAGFPESLANAAGLALEMERLEPARELYARAAALRPQFADAQFGLGQIALREHRFAAGWEGYERRFETAPPQAVPRMMSIPPLDASNLAQARRVAIWSEQGLGDQVLFTSLLPELQRRGIQAVVEVDARLLGLYRRSLPGFEFVASAGSAEAFAACDFHLPMGSLPRLFRPDASSFAAQPRAFLVPDPERVEECTRALAGRAVIAISWRSPQGGSRRVLGERKSVPLESFAALAERTGARLLDLQYGDVDEERRAFDSRHPGLALRLEGLDTRNDLDGVAAALVACGRFVSASNATAHLAGALGVPTELLLPRGWPPFFYWAPGADRRSLWYPSVTIATAA